MPNKAFHATILALRARPASERGVGSLGRRLKNAAGQAKPDGRASVRETLVVRRTRGFAGGPTKPCS